MSDEERQDGATPTRHEHDHGHDGGQSHGGNHDHHDEHGHDDHGHGHDHDHEEPKGLIGRVRALYNPHSHDAADSIDSALESSERGIRAVKISLVALMATAVLQVLVVLVTGSVALLADTIHNFSDALTSIPLWIAFVLGRRLATRSYTYGYRRAEDLSGLFIVLMIAFSAVLAGWESIRRLADPKDIENLGLVAAAGVIGFIGNELVAIYRIRVGRQINSAALIADGQHARTDGLTSLAVLLGAIGVWAGFPAADPIIGLLITVAILFVLKDAAQQVFRRLMDGVEPETVDAVERVAREVPEVRSVEGVRVRWVGHRLDANLQITVDPDLSVAEGHDIAEKVTRRLFSSIRQLEDVMVHVDPEGLEHYHTMNGQASITRSEMEEEAQ